MSDWDGGEGSHTFPPGELTQQVSTLEASAAVEQLVIGLLQEADVPRDVTTLPPSTTTAAARKVGETL